MEIDYVSDGVHCWQPGTLDADMAIKIILKFLINNKKITCQHLNK